MAADDPDQRPMARATGAEIEVPASPEEIWEAIATGAGTGAWLFPAEIEAGEGGTMTIHRRPYGPDAVATVTAWDPPYRFAYEEPVPTADGSAGSVPLATEFLVKARGGGTCVVRVVSGLRREPPEGEGWEDLVEGAGEGWRMALTVLRSYLTHFAGQPARGNVDVIAGVGRPLDHRAEVAAAVMGLLGLTGLAAGDGFRTPDGTPDLAGVVEHIGRCYVVLCASEPCPALVAISAFPMDGVTLSVNVCGRFYGPDGTTVARREQRRWSAWLSAVFEPHVRIPEGDG